MKQFLILVLFSLSSLAISAQNSVDNLFKRYKNDSGVVSMKFEGDVSSFFDEESDIKSSIESVNFYMFQKGKDISEKDRKKMLDRVQKDKYDTLIQARDNGKKVVIMGIEEGDAIKKVFAQINSEEMNIYFFLNGTIYLEDLSKLDLDSLGDMSF